MLPPDLLQTWLLPAVATAAVGVVFARWAVERARHEARLAAIPVRIHVNGIRGKSTVVRLLAGALRAGGLTTVAKTTGSAPRVIDTEGRDHAIRRRGAPTLLEQLDILQHEVPPDADAVVIECMAIRPDYQRASERRMIRSTLHLLTNVRRDHVEQLGETLPAIARSLTAGFPVRGRVLTAERAPDQLAELRRGADALATGLTVVDPAALTDEELAEFGPFAFRDNLALALAAAEAAGVDRTTALAGMRAAPADPGAAVLAEHEVDGRRVTWVDLFAVNDPESTLANVEKAVDWARQDAGVVLLLNNRADRRDRAYQFADLAAERLPHDIVALAGAYAGPVAGRLAARSVDRAAIRRIGDPPGDAAERVLRELAAAPGTDRVLLIGLANVHTALGEALQRRLAPPPGGGGAGGAAA